MAATPPICDFGWTAPRFTLPATDGRSHALDDLRGRNGTLIAFICNHCPYVKSVIGRLVRDAHDLAALGIATIAINANDAAQYPEDGFDEMKAFARQHQLPFPYLHDETQDVALAYNAICTPDFFLYDQSRLLYYAGQFDASRPKINRPPVPGLPPLRTDLPVTGEDMRRAVDALLAGAPAPQPQHPSAGCSIKWRPGKDPSWG